MLKTLLESLDENLFTPELLESIETEFNEAVKNKVETEVALKESQILEGLKQEYDVQLNEAKAEQSELLREEFNAVVDTLNEQVESYIDLVVDNFINEQSDAIESFEKQAQAEAMVEAFDAMLLTGGVSVADINESRTDNVNLAKIAELSEKVDRLVNENTKYKSENDDLIKLGLINEMKEGLSIVQSEKFQQLSEMVTFEKSVAYMNKLLVLKESITGKVEKEEPKAPEKLVTEAVEKPAKPSFTIPKHLM